MPMAEGRPRGFTFRVDCTRSSEQWTTLQAHRVSWLFLRTADDVNSRSPTALPERMSRAHITSRRDDRCDPWSECMVGGSIRGATTALADVIATWADD